MEREISKMKKQIVSLQILLAFAIIFIFIGAFLFAKLYKQNVSLYYYLVSGEKPSVSTQSMNGFSYPVVPTVDFDVWDELEE